MRISEILSETFPYPPGAQMPSNIIDYRDPAMSKGRYVTYKSDPKKRYWRKAPRTHICLTKSGGVIVYYYGHDNTIDWKDLLAILSKDMDLSLQQEYLGIVVKGTGYLIDRDRSDTKSWSGHRNRYSLDIRTTVQALVDRGVATPDMPIWIGNWATKDGEHVGSVGSILKRSEGEIPSRITLFHGTSSFRLQHILQHGLQPMAFEDRVWNHTSIDKVRPEHREDSVYLTASRPQAEYYAKKATNIDRARNNSRARSDQRRKRDWIRSQLSSLTWKMDHGDFPDDEKASVQDRIKEMTSQLDKIEKVTEFYGKFEPVILQITLPKSEYAKMMADDDFLRAKPGSNPGDWLDSLSHFGQVAYRGSIPPSRIKVISQGKDAGQRSY